MSGTPSGEAGSPESGEAEAFRTDYPHLAEVVARAAETPFSFDGEFEHGLELILAALEPAAGSPGV